MIADHALKMVSDLFWTGLVVCLPILGLTMLGGVVISMIQVVTQIQEMTLTFVPKLLVAGISVVIFGSWMLEKLGQFATQLWLSIPNMF